MTLFISADVPKWSYRDALEMRLSSNRHESSNLSICAKKYTFIGVFLHSGECVQLHTVRVSTDNTRFLTTIVVT